MKVRIEEEIYAGTPSEIVELLRENAFDREQFPDLDGYIGYMCESFERMTDLSCTVRGESLDDRAKELLLRFADIDALEVLEDE